MDSSFNLIWFFFFFFWLFTHTNRSSLAHQRYNSLFFQATSAITKKRCVKLECNQLTCTHGNRSSLLLCAAFLSRSAVFLQHCGCKIFVSFSFNLWLFAIALECATWRKEVLYFFCISKLREKSAHT